MRYTRTWHNESYRTPRDIDGPEELEDMGFDIYSKEPGWICAVSGMLIVSEYQDVDCMTRQEQKNRSRSNIAFSGR